MTIDADELREIAKEVGLPTDEILALLDELKKARVAERAAIDSHDAWATDWCAKLDAVTAERDRLAVLLREADLLLENTRVLLRARIPGPDYRASAIAQAIDDLRARIAAALGDKP